MKNPIRLLMLILSACVIMISCKKKPVVAPVYPLGPNIPAGVNDFVTPKLLDSLKAHGAIINEGLSAPNVNGIYLFNPAYCIYDNSTPSAAGSELGDYKFQFTNQNAGQNTIALNYKEIDSGSDIGSDNSATFISGSGNLFTIFAKATGIEEGVNYTSILIVSGQLSNGGISNLQLYDYFLSKIGDSSNSILVPVGTLRIVKDEDGFSETQTTFSTGGTKIQSIGSNQLKSIFSALGGTN